MEESCPVCGKTDCHPREKNSLGVEIQEYRHETGWVSASEPYATYCLAKQAMQALPAPKKGVSRRTYSALMPRP